MDFSTCNGCFYHNFQYVNGYTNDGQLMGTWIGRASQGEAIWSNLLVQRDQENWNRAQAPKGGSSIPAARWDTERCRPELGSSDEIGVPILGYGAVRALADTAAGGESPVQHHCVISAQLLAAGAVEMSLVKPKLAAQCETDDGSSEGAMTHGTRTIHIY